MKKQILLHVCLTLFVPFGFLYTGYKLTGYLWRKLQA